MENKSRFKISVFIVLNRILFLFLFQFVIVSQCFSLRSYFNIVCQLFNCVVCSENVTFITHVLFFIANSTLIFLCTIFLIIPPPLFQFILTAGTVNFVLICRQPGLLINMAAGTIVQYILVRGDLLLKVCQWGGTQ